jgi:hypothetical protein
MYNFALFWLIQRFLGEMEGWQTFEFTLDGDGQHPRLREDRGREGGWTVIQDQTQNIVSRDSNATRFLNVLFGDS